MVKFKKISSLPKRFKGAKLGSFKNFLNFNKFFGMFSHDVGIDLGTANTLVWVKGKGIVIREPSAVARHKKTKEILAIGTSANKMFGRAPKTIEVIRPLRNGVISDFDATAAMLDHYIKKIHESGSAIPKVPRPRVIIGIPSGVTEVERRAVADAAVSAGASEAHLIEEPMAAAIGAGLKVDNPTGKFVVDIGGGTCEIAVISLGGIVLGRSERIAGDVMNEAIVSYARLKYSLLLGEQTAEQVKIDIGSAAPQKTKKNNKKKTKEEFAVARGRDLETGLPKSIKLSETEVREALAPTVRKIVEAIQETIEETPPELISDIMEKGITMAGGGSLLKRIDKLIAEETNMDVWIADDPLTCVVKGCGKLLEKPSLLKKVRVTKGL